MAFELLEAGEILVFELLALSWIRLVLALNPGPNPVDSSVSSRKTPDRSTRRWLSSSLRPNEKLLFISSLCRPKFSPNRLRIDSKNEGNYRGLLP